MWKPLVLLVLLLASVEGRDINLNYLNPRVPVEDRVKDLLQKMTLEEKIGQMTQIDRSVVSAEIMKKYGLGSLLTVNLVPSEQVPPQQWIHEINEYQNGSLSTRLKIPMIYGIDAVHGHNNFYGATIFPHNVGLGATRDPDLVKRIGAATALEMMGTGMNFAFAPCVAVCRDPRWGRCYESYGEDPEIVKQMTDFVLGIQGQNSPLAKGRKVAGCAKHYVGDGGTRDGMNEGNTVIDWDGLLKLHMPGYVEAIKRGVYTIMVSYSSVNGVKMHTNYDLITKHLKNTLNFTGIVISDSSGLDKITDPNPHANYTNSVLLGINAGIDMVMVPLNYEEFISTLTSLVNNNYIPMSRIDDAVSRILRVKFEMGVFEEPLADYIFVSQLGSNNHRELAREAVRKSLVLLKNGENGSDPILPLPKKATTVLVTGTHAHNLGYQCGGWTLTWQGQGGNSITKGTTVFEAVKNTVNPSTQVVFEEKTDAKYLKEKGFEYAIVAVGEKPYAESFGDSKDLKIEEPGGLIVNTTCAVIKCVVIIMSGRPVFLQPYVGVSKAIVAAWLPGTEGQGIADVLFGDYAFTAKLPHTWFKTPDQLPMNFGDPHYDPLYPFGFGLQTKPIPS